MIVIRPHDDWIWNSLWVVGFRRHHGITRHRHVLDRHRSASVGSDSDPSGSSASTAANLEEIVRLPGRTQPCLAFVDADIKLCSPPVCIDDLRRKPILGDATLQVNL